ncbi:unnamed protein product [Ranitomeya imitator]|uniref:A-kinase anchor protein 7-like phosphoesterase domain-containing protein n=1 Tax=Ranitomeya imitator TaxID=111125 RepID=A0ABN9LLF0_9NEOB|nr:unnamed protein product [Ranitomeya imitator]
MAKIDGKMDGAKYRTILEENLLESAKDLRLGWSFVFQQDNDPKHKAKSTMEWFTNKRIQLQRFSHLSFLERASEDETAERNQQKRKRRIKQKKTSSHKKKPGSVECLLIELPFAHADICSVLETTKAVDKKVKKKRKRHQLETDEDDKSEKKKRPNYFVSLPITNVKILDDIKTIQNSVLEKDDRLSSAMIPQGSFHLTLFVMHLATEEEVAL